MRVVIFLISLLLAPAANAAASCELNAIAECKNTNQLVWASSFEPALRSFLDGRKVSWFGTKRSIAEVVAEVLGGVPDNVTKVEGGILRFSAVRPHSATERGAIFISDTGTIRAIGVLHFNCVKRCEKTYALSMIMSEKDGLLISLAQAWGNEQMALNKQNDLEDSLTKIGRTEILTIKR